MAEVQTKLMHKLCTHALHTHREHEGHGICDAYAQYWSLSDLKLAEQAMQEFYANHHGERFVSTIRYPGSLREERSMGYTDLIEVAYLALQTKEQI